jgi:non-heme chloroperoxidase
VNTINVGYEDATAIELHYVDCGAGRPVLFIHGWPVGSLSWEKQIAAVCAAGYRAIAYDRRGFGESSQPDTGYDFDTFAEDLHQIITTLDLRDITLVGFAMGCGEVSRYLGTYGSERVRSAVFISALPPFLLKTEDNPLGLQMNSIDEFWNRLIGDRAAFLQKFLVDFCGPTENDPPGSGDALLRDLQAEIESASTPALHCVATWLTDFRDDLHRISIPTLILHGKDDPLMPLESTAIPLANSIGASRLEIFTGAMHGLPWTRAKLVNSFLLDFLRV